MHTLFHRSGMALAVSLLWVSASEADELRYSDLEARIAQIETQVASQDSVALAACCQDADSGCGGSECCGAAADCCCGCNSCCGGYYADVQFNFFRGHVAEGAIVTGSKLSEEYELSPRFILGYENCCGQGARVRYWHHGHHHNNLNGPGGIRFEWDVIDLELTKRIRGCRTDVLLSGGARAADINVEYTVWDAHTNAIGLTAAADVRTLLCCDCCSEWAAVYGGRLAILAGDINGGTQGLVRDQNWRVWELYAGVEHRCCYCGMQLYSRLALELQNWHIDSMPGEITAANETTIGFVGPSWTIGADF